MFLMFIVNFVIETKFPLVLCVLKTVKMICNSIAYLINKYNFVSTHLFWGRLWNSQQRIAWSMIYGWGDRLLQLRQKERLSPAKYF
jgi:hypothetical protein